jgi:hypothetical protein
MLCHLLHRIELACALMDLHLQSETSESTSFAELEQTCLENICRLLKIEVQRSCLFVHFHI